jgi:hypothetical protein
MKADSKKNSKKWWQSSSFFALCMLLVVYAIPSAVFGKTAVSLVIDSLRIRNMKQELSIARQRWHENTPYRYQVTISSQKFFADDVPLECNLEPDVIFQDGEAVDGEYWDLCQNVYNSVSVEKMFDQIEQELSNASTLPTYIKLEFDSQYGYISNFYIECYDEGLISKKGCSSILPLFQKYGYDYKTFWFEDLVVLQQENPQ